MPTYEYRCDACEHQFEEFQSITAAPLKKCPACSKAKLRRLIGTGAGIIFKGSGFYQTDYRSESYQKAAKAESDGGGKKTESTPATPAATSGGDAAKPAPAAAAAKSEPPAKPAKKPAAAK